MEAQEQNTRILCLKRLYLDAKDVVLKVVLSLLSQPLEITPFQVKCKRDELNSAKLFKQLNKYMSKTLANI